MPCIQYIEKRFSASSQKIIDQANEIIDEYEAQGYNLTLRQLYYQFISRDLFPEDRRWVQVGSKWVKDPNGDKNATPNYKWMGTIVNDGRLTGQIDWDAIEDRTRNLNKVPSWADPGDMVEAAAKQYKIDLWANQFHRIEVWVEKQALEPVIKRAAKPWGVPSLACKGYMSQSEMWSAAQRFLEYQKDGQTPLIIHLGDHDPSGIDMTRDIRDRLVVFGMKMEVERIALNMDQVTHYNPPPDPAKLSDSRVHGYIMKYGNKSWELDALEPKVLNKLIDDAIADHCDLAKLTAKKNQQEHERKLLEDVSGYWGDVAEFVEEKVEEDNAEEDD